ncbi:hypothetical protein [Halochromatium salexigens]|uniref:Hydrolase or metal-binding protein n=1 Tax=Halochromatium salexigens TaxID=49447 RepID=A0AAJ0UED3_HALSE|nr:hypothetical protein [Halochromatium salexigens]MBK5929892.1 hydrolase or metal-binding protein [Halochromatium salexigens]
MLKGFVITPPILGRITIGKVVEHNGKRLPQKDDQFTLTSQLQTPDGWRRHPLDEALRNEQQDKLRRLPIRLLFNAPELNFRAEYALFDRQTARPLCVGDGDQCRRRTKEGMETLPCPAPEGCALAQGGACKPYGRLNVRIGEDDPLGSFIFRTTGFNSIRTLAARLAYFQAISGNRLACLPLELRLRAKSTRQSYGKPIFYADLTLREGWTLEQTLLEAQRVEEERQHSGFDQQALDQAARAGLANGAFEDSPEESPDIIEEFYPDPGQATSASAEARATPSQRVTQLRDSLKQARAAQQPPASEAHSG